MTCFWNGLISALDRESFRTVLGYKGKNKPRPNELVNLLKKKAIKTTDVTWNGSPLTQKELEENLERVKSLNVKSISRGYDCSCCDPFLLLVCQLFKRNINHKYLNNTMKYAHKNPTNNRSLEFRSNRGHFWHGR